MIIVQGEIKNWKLCLADARRDPAFARARLNENAPYIARIRANLRDAQARLGEINAAANEMDCYLGRKASGPHRRVGAADGGKE